jgi:hypothetical protein
MTLPSSSPPHIPKKHKKRKEKETKPSTHLKKDKDQQHK